MTTADLGHEGPVGGKTAELEGVKLAPFDRERLPPLAEELPPLGSEKAAPDAEAERLTISAPHAGMIGTALTIDCNLVKVLGSLDLASLHGGNVPVRA